jgi:hypothetical protein
MPLRGYCAPVKSFPGWASYYSGMKPTVGRIVHYSPSDLYFRGETWAAIVTAVHEDGSVNICAFSKKGDPTPLSKVCEGDRPGTWSWPLRVKDEPKAFDPQDPTL